MYVMRLILFSICIIITAITYGQDSYVELKKHIKSANKHYPVQVSRGVIAVKKVIEDSSLVTINEVDDALTSFYKLKSRSAKMKNTFLGMYGIEPTLNKTASLVIGCKMQIVERYVCKQTREIFDIVLRKEELRNVLYNDSTYLRDKDVKIDSLVQDNVNEWKKSVWYYLTDPNDDFNKNIDAEERSQVFLFQNYLDKEKYRNLNVPIISINIVDENTGKVKKFAKSIQELSMFLAKVKSEISRVEVSQVTVYVVDAIEKIQDSFNSNPYFSEHICSVDIFALVDGRYESKKHEDINIFIKRGHTTFRPFRAEDQLLSKDQAVILFGDVELFIYTK